MNLYEKNSVPLFFILINKMLTQGTLKSEIDVFASIYI